MRKFTFSPAVVGALFLIGCIIISVHLRAQVYNWSKTATNNGASDPNINFEEGMAPAAFDANTRAFMAAIANWRDDISGPANQATYSSGVYSVTSHMVFTSLTVMQGSEICFYAPTTNAGGDSLSVDGLTAKPIQIGNGVAVPGGVIIAGSPYCALYNASGGSFFLFDYDGVGASLTMPIGAVVDYAGPSPTSSFAVADGQCVSQSTYATLFSLVGGEFGSCGSGLFALPDLRGRVVAGIGNMGGGDNGLMSDCGTQDTVGGVCGAQNETIAEGNLPNYILPGSFTFSGTTQQWTMNSTNEIPANTQASFPSDFLSTGAPIVLGGANEFQPTITFTPSGTLTGVVTLGGSGVALTTVQPAVLVNKLIRVQ